MKKIALIIAMALCSVGAVGQEYEWRHVEMDGSRTGTASPSKDNVAETVGTFKDGKYVAPNGKTFKKRSTVGRTARIVLDAQPAMARVKDVIGYSTEAMEVAYPESALSDWFIDIIMARAEELMGKKVDIGIGNFGGIRIDMPQGDIILDDMLSMFPFKNQLVYVEHKGKEIRKILEQMAAGRFEVLGGVRVVAEDGKLVSAEIGGEPIDDEKVYGLATISFLLTGGDGLTLADNALSVTVFENEDIIDAVLAHVNAETAAGRPIEYKMDGRVTVKGDRRRK
jgi:2',3'-cyclic-nucleotide 2'-phosphodiesterase (5'-nucleotidase family)